MKNIYNNLRAVMLLMLVAAISASSAFASSHREAPLISNDPLADNVDLYAFRSPDAQDMITIIATYIPMQLPHGGPNYYSFGENIRYEIHVDNDAAVPGDEVTYRFTFFKENNAPNTFFYIRAGLQNHETTYNLERSTDGGATFTTIITGGVVPPYNVGPRSIESSVGLNTTYEALYTGAITTASTGENVFAGPTDDPFFVDLGGIFDLGNSPRQAGKNVDAIACLNVSAIAIQVPISTLLKEGAPSEPTDILDPDYVIGVWASASRPAMTTLSRDADPVYSGDWIQVSRLGMPLTNEAVIAIGDKDYWNAITPYDEISETTLDGYFYNPELALYMDDDQFGGAVPAFADLRIQEASLGGFDFTNGGDGLFSLKGTAAVEGTALDDAVFGTLLLPGAGQPRSVDLWPAFHTGVPNVIPYQLATGKGGNPLAAGKPFVNNFLPNGGDMLRLNMAVPVTARDDANFSSLGLVQAAAIGLTVAPFNETADLEFLPNMDGFPNGRRLEDDVTRIELQAVAGVVLAAVGLWYDDFDPATSPSPVTQDLLNVLTFTTGVESNDREFRSSFPYLATPHSGTGPCSGEIYDGEVDEDIVVKKNLFASSNTTGKVGVFRISDDAISSTEFVSQDMDADGIFYDDESDVLYQLNRSANVIDVYTDVLANLASGVRPTYSSSSTSDFSNGREIAVSGSKLVVAQDANDGNGMVNKFAIYDVTETGLVFQKEYISDLNLWGIHLDGNTMYAIQDNSANVLEYNNFFSAAPGTIVPDNVVAVADMIRTHGITYDADSDIMVLTDVGDAGSRTDGAVLIINNYTSANDDNVITDEEQLRIEGDNSTLGNPVDVAYDAEDEVLYVAERANMGGRLLVFNAPSADGDATPAVAESFAGISAVYLEGSTGDFMMNQVGTVFISSNTASEITIGDILEDNTLSTQSFMIAAEDADGIHYDDENDVLYQLNRSDNVIEAYSDVKSSLENGEVPTITATSSSDFANGREITVAGEFMVVAQDAADANGNLNQLFVYRFSPTSITLVNTYTVGINLWGIDADVNTLYAIVDNSDQLAVYNDFFLNVDGDITPDAIITVDGIGRTHGLDYYAADDIMVLTDVAMASSAIDGAIVTVPTFTTASADGTIDASEQQRIAGAATMLGNPVDVSFDPVNSLILVAERANEGGKVLVFAANASGDVAPLYSELVPGASAIYLEGSTSDENPITGVIDTEGERLSYTLFPNPVSDFMNVQIDGSERFWKDAIIQVVDMQGRVLLTEKQSFSTVTLAMSGIPAGSYIVKIEKGNLAIKEVITKM